MVGQVAQGELVGEGIVGERPLQIGCAHAESGERLVEMRWATEVAAVVGLRAQRGVGEVHGHGPIGGAQKQVQHPHRDTEGEFHGLALRGSRIE